MDAKGRAVQATGALFMLVAKILLAFFLVPNFGGTGAVAATVFAVSLFMIVPTRISAVRRLQRREFN